MKIKMLVQTRFDGSTIKPGDELDVAANVAERWASKGLAEIIEEEKSVKDPKGMTAKELYALCKEKGIDVEEKQPKAVYLEALGITE